MNRTSPFPSGWGQGREQESRRVGKISNMLDILLTLQDKPGNNNRPLLTMSVKPCKTWFETQRTCYGKLTQSKSGQVPKYMTERQSWIQDKIPEVAHLTQGTEQVIRIQVPGPRSQYFSCFSTRHITSRHTDSM